MRYLLSLFILIFVLMKVGNAQPVTLSTVIQKGGILQLAGDERVQKSVEIYSLNGQLLRNFTISNSIIKIENLCLASGVYQVQVRSGSLVVTGQIILP